MCSIFLVYAKEPAHGYEPIVTKPYQMDSSVGVQGQHKQIDVSGSPTSAAHAASVPLIPPEEEAEESPMKSMMRAYLACLVISALLLVLVSRILLYSSAHPAAWVYLAAAGFVGILLSWAFVLITDYYTGIGLSRFLLLFCRHCFCLFVCFSLVL